MNEGPTWSDETLARTPEDLTLFHEDFREIDVPIGGLTIVKCGAGFVHVMDENGAEVRFPYRMTSDLSDELRSFQPLPRKHVEPDGPLARVYLKHAAIQQRATLLSQARHR